MNYSHKSCGVELGLQRSKMCDHRSRNRSCAQLVTAGMSHIMSRDRIKDRPARKNYRAAAKGSGRRQRSMIGPRKWGGVLDILDIFLRISSTL